MTVDTLTWAIVAGLIAGYWLGWAFDKPPVDWMD